MSGVATALGWVLAGVLAWTGAAKLRRPGRTAAAFAALGLPGAGTLAIAVPAAELLTATLLVALPRVGGAAAALLLGGFTVFLAVRLRGGGTVDCGCFGTARSEPLTAAALLRNALLMGAAGAASVSGSAAVPSLEAVLVAGAAFLIGALAVALLDVRLRIGRLWDNTLPTGPEGAA